MSGLLSEIYIKQYTTTHFSARRENNQKQLF